MLKPRLKWSHEKQMWLVIACSRIDTWGDMMKLLDITLAHVRYSNPTRVHYVTIKARGASLIDQMSLIDPLRGRSKKNQY